MLLSPPPSPLSSLCDSTEIRWGNGEGQVPLSYGVRVLWVTGQLLTEGTHLPASQRFNHCEHWTSTDMEHSAVCWWLPLTSSSFQRLYLWSSWLEKLSKWLQANSFPRLSQMSTSFPSTCHCCLLLRQPLSSLCLGRGTSLSHFSGTGINLLNSKNMIRTYTWAFWSHSNLTSCEGKSFPPCLKHPLPFLQGKRVKALIIWPRHAFCRFQ